MYFYVYVFPCDSVPRSAQKQKQSFTSKNLLTYVPLVYCLGTIGASSGECPDVTAVAEGIGNPPSFGDHRMSYPPQRRAVTLPIPLTKGQERPVTASAFSGRHTPSDDEVMALLQSNDAGAMEILFDRYARLVFRIALGVVRDHGEAEDVVQEAFFHLYKKSLLFDGTKGTVKNWILQVALHRALDKKEHLARRGFYLGTDIHSLDDTLIGRTDLDREIGAMLNRVQLEKAFEELPDIQRETLELFYFEGLDLREISKKFSQPLGNTRHHFYRGLERLRKSSFVQKLRESKRC